MSASLVGSEMCIRDSAPPAAGPSERRSATPRTSPRPRASRARSSGRPGPVSYTHLTLPTICSV
eukprot:2464158-Alexandrium_andersonii.AAC.1